MGVRPVGISEGPGGLTSEDGVLGRVFGLLIEWISEADENSSLNVCVDCRAL